MLVLWMVAALLHMSVYYEYSKRGCSRRVNAYYPTWI